MFGNPHYTGTRVQTFAACEKLWNESSNRKKAKGSITVGHNTELRKYTDRYEVTFHGNCIVTYYPEYRSISGGGWRDSITTQGRIYAFTGVRVANDSRCGFNHTLRINGYPFFDGIRVDNHGNIFPEDIRSDTKTVPKKEGVQQYVALWRKIEKGLAGRWAVGEWANHSWVGPSFGAEALLHVEKVLASGETFLPHDDVVRLFGVYIDKPNLKDAIKAARDALRRDYYIHNDMYETKEISNG